MTVVVRLFARLRELAGADAIAVVVAAPTVAGVRAAVADQLSAGLELVARSAVAVNGEYAQDGQTVVATDEVALIPPVSGG
jgi:molybdopterin converting factor subunit 1